MSPPVPKRSSKKKRLGTFRLSSKKRVGYSPVPVSSNPSNDSLAAASSGEETVVERNVPNQDEQETESEAETENETNDDEQETENEASEDESQTTNNTASSNFESLRRKSQNFKRTKNLTIQTSDEIKLFELAELGNFTGIKELLFTTDGGTNEHIDINKPSLNGYTILQVAIQRGDENLVQLLFTMSDIEIQDSLFYAIKEQNITLVKMILQHVVDTHPPLRSSLRGQPSVSSSGPSSNLLANAPPPLTIKDAIKTCTLKKNLMEASEFEEDITPVMLAAHVGNYELIKFFHKHYDFLPSKDYENEIHAPYCSCAQCKITGSVGMALKRQHYFEAASNPSYMIFMANTFGSYDPILDAFELIKKMEEYQKYEQAMNSKYESLIEDLKTFATDLLGLCRSSEEVEVLLSQRNGYDGDSAKFPRLFLALQWKQMEFVAHPHSQQILYNEWSHDKLHKRRHQSWITLLEFLGILIFLPFLGLWLLIDDYTSLAKEYSRPLHRFQSSLASYIWFLILLVLHASLNFDVYDHSISREIYSAIIEWLLVIFVLGHICSAIRQIKFMPRTFIELPWNWYDALTHLAFIITFSFWAASWFKPRYIQVEDKDDEPRILWHKDDPLLIAEAFFAIATILSFGRVLRHFQLHHRLGPLQVALSYMCKKAGLALLLVCLAILSFACALALLYKAYDSIMGSKIAEIGGKSPPHKQVNDAFSSISSSMITLYWALFAMSSWESPKITEIKNETVNLTVYPLPQHHAVIEVTGIIIFGIFHIFGNIVLVNTVVALMTGAGSVVFDNVDVEWKFARSQMWMFYGIGKVPSPFNVIRLLINPGSYRYVSRLIKKVLRKEDSYKEKRQQEKTHLKKSYAKLVKCLIQRYFFEKAEAALNEEATSDQITNIRETMAEIKDKYKELSTRSVTHSRRKQRPLRRAKTEQQDNYYIMNETQGT